MIASLPMYDWPEVRAATDAWWRGLARHFKASIELDRSVDFQAVWRGADLLFSQTCGYPFTHEFKDLLRYVATPHYAVDGCDGANYRSIIFARDRLPLEAFRGAAAAVNDPDSMSGMLALKLVFGPSAWDGHFFGRAIRTGGHLNSLLAVREGRADVCAIDAVCVGLARRYRPDCLGGLVEIARSPMVPGLPYVTRCGDIDSLREAIAGAFADPELREAREQLLLSGHSVLEPGAYDRITDLELEMQKAGGLDLL
jgi:ABC-type phosphate/phosphonate transport system substrate-binding protein